MRILIIALLFLLLQCKSVRQIPSDSTNLIGIWEVLNFGKTATMVKRKSIPENKSTFIIEDSGKLKVYQPQGWTSTNLNYGFNYGSWIRIRKNILSIKYTLQTGKRMQVWNVLSIHSDTLLVEVNTLQ